jgi:hypothetical protein
MTEKDISHLCMVPVYLECTHWPTLRAKDGTDRRAGDSYGAIECPFCDYVLCPERGTLWVGDRCKRCEAIVVCLTPTGYKPNTTVDGQGTTAK